MRSSHAYLLFTATLLTALGYGATFLMTEHFRTLGGSEIETGKTLIGAMVGTLVGVPLVGWFAGRLGAARMASLGALLVAIGYAMIALQTAISPLLTVAGLFIGLGWGAFYLAAPLALSGRVTDQERGFWFLRFGVFQMGGIGLSPIASTALINHLGLSTAEAFSVIAGACALASAMLFSFEIISPRPHAAQNTGGATAWVRALPALVRSRALFPILMVGLGASVFTGLMTFQTSLIRGTTLEAGTYFGAYAITVVGSRFFLAPTLTKADSDRMAVLLLVLMSLGVVLAFGFPAGVLVQLASAITLGLGYGLVYSIIQTQAVNDAPSPLRSAALTWFVIAYFVGIFGFPMLGGWLIVHIGNHWFLTVVLSFALAELALALIRLFGKQKKVASAAQ